MNMIPAISSNIEFVGYAPEKLILAVQYKGGALYHYLEVPWIKWDAIEAINLVLHVQANAIASRILGVDTDPESREYGIPLSVSGIGLEWFAGGKIDISLGKFIAANIKGIHECQKIVSAE